MTERGKTMTEQETHSTQAADLRCRAEEEIIRENADESPKNLLALSHEETRIALHELRVHQIELEMQNTTLRRREEELDAARVRYFDLYELAPVGYITVSEPGLILEANLTAATMLGVARGVPGLAHPIFSRLIHGEDQKGYYLFRKQLLETGKAQACELRMVKKDGPAFWAHLEATVTQEPSTDSRQAGERVIRVVISDITERKQKEAQNLLEQAVEERTKQLRQETQARKQPQELLQQENDTILLVDDEPHVISALTRTLRNSPYQLLTAGSAAEALKIMETTKIKVIVSDEMMEGMRGSELLVEVQKRFPHTIRILLTGQATLEASMRAVNVGQVYRFLTKPWDESMLRLSLSAATEKYNSDAEMRRLQDALLQSEERYKTVVEQSPQPVVVHRDGMIIYANPAAIKMFGATSLQALAGKPILDRVHPDEHEAVLARLQTVTLRGVISPMVERRYFRIDGSEFTGEIQGTPILYDGLPAFHLAIHDITDRKQAEMALQEAHDLLEQRVEERTIQLRQEIEAQERLQAALQESEEKFRTVADWTYDWEYWINPQKRVLLYISPSVERITGYTPEAFLADYGLMDRIVHPDDRPLWDQHVWENRTKTDVTELTFRIITASGEVRWIGHECQAVIAADGRPLGRRSSNRDITRQKLAEEELRKSEERLQLAIQLADVGIWELDAVSNRLTWDETMYRFYGITPDKFSGAYEAWKAGLHPEDMEAAHEAMQRALRGEGEFNPEFRIVWPDRSIHWMKASARIERDPEGRPLSVTGMNLDVTADKLLVEAAEAASRAKSLFIGNMSHELRTPLSGVLGMTEALLNTPLAEQQRGYAETIRKSGKALLAVVGNILDFSKISAGNMALESSPFFVESVIENVVHLFGPPAAEEKIGLHTIIDPELPAVRGDVHRLTQVISNLVGNAVKFTKKGEIQVAVKIMRQTEIEVELAIGVQDTGIGMTEEELSRIFTGFTQGDTTKGRRFGGTGLGLTISRNLVELMGGKIQVESVFGKGSLFTVLVTFPIAQGFVRMKSELKSSPANSPSAPITPVAPPKPERPPGDLAELQMLLEQMKTPLDNGEPRPCKEIMATLLEKSWPEEQETLLAELNRLIKLYRHQEALDLLNKDAAG